MSSWNEFDEWYRYVISHRLGVSLGSSHPILLEYIGGPLDGDFIMGLGNSATAAPSSSVSCFDHFEHHYTRIGSRMFYLGAY